MTIPHPAPTSSAPGSQAPGVPDPSVRWARFGPLLGVVWVVFLAEPLREALRADGIVLRVVGVVGVVGVAVVFTLALIRYRKREELRPRTAALILGVQLVCVVLTTLVTQQHGLVGLVFVGVTLVFLASRRTALIGVALIVVALAALPRVIPGWQPEDGTVLSAVLAGLAVFGTRGVMDRNRQLFRAHEEVAALAVSRERERIARDMHDILGHSLTVVSVKAELAARLLRSGSEEDGAPELTPAVQRAAAELGEIQALARSALADMRGMVAGERQVTLAGELAAARSAFDSAGIAADLPGAVDEVPEDHRKVFAWALREGTTNVLRHAAARRATVTLASDTLVIDDDGRGTRPGERAASSGVGNGLSGLAERVRQAGLVMETGESPLGGFRLAVRAAGTATADTTGRTEGGVA